MHSSKSPELDGLSPFLFQKFWHIVGPDVTEAMLFVLYSGHLLHKMDYEQIVLIPKRNDPQCMIDFRLGVANGRVGS